MRDGHRGARMCRRAMLVREPRRATGCGGSGVPVPDAQLAGLVAVGFDALTWFEEETLQLSHPRDPYHRIDVRPTGQHLVMSQDGVVVVGVPQPRHGPLRA